jgi:Pretoxin HINT domain
MAGGDSNYYAYVGNDLINRNDPSGMSFQSFGQGFKDGFTGSIVQAIVITAVLGSLISAAIASGGLVAALATEFAQALAAFGAGASLGEFAYILSNFCGDDRDYRLGVLLGQIAASLTPGVVLGVLGKLAGRIPGSGGECSFVAGTPVTTEEGDKPIEQVKTGDKVLSRNEKTGEQSYHRVLQTFATPDDEIYSLQLQTAEGKQETLQVTANHPFWLKGKGWTETDLLKSGDLIEAKDGKWLTVEAVQPTQEKATGYNLEVETDHTYFVGNQKIWVHNNCDPWVRNPSSVQDRLALEAAQRGEGTKIIDNLGDPKYQGMEKWEFKVKSEEGKDSVVHYVRDPATDQLMDFKFNKRSTDK